MPDYYYRIISTYQSQPSLDRQLTSSNSRSSLGVGASGQSALLPRSASPNKASCRLPTSLRAAHAGASSLPATPVVLPVVSGKRKRAGKRLQSRIFQESRHREDSGRSVKASRPTRPKPPQWNQGVTQCFRRVKKGENSPYFLLLFARFTPFKHVSVRGI